MPFSDESTVSDPKDVISRECGLPRKGQQITLEIPNATTTIESTINYVGCCNAREDFFSARSSLELDFQLHGGAPNRSLYQAFLL